MRRATRRLHRQRLFRRFNRANHQLHCTRRLEASAQITTRRARKPITVSQASIKKADRTLQWATAEQVMQQ